MALCNGIEAGPPAGIAMVGDDKSPSPRSNDVASTIFLIKKNLRSESSENNA
jgi:hypothetical protein